MKLLLIAPLSSTHVTKWANSLVGRVGELHIASMHPPIEELNSKIKVHKLPIKAPLGYVANLLFLKNIIKNIEPNLIHTHQLTGHGVLSLLAVKKTNHLISMYGSDIFDFPNKSIFHKMVIKLVSENAIHLASTSIAMRDQFYSLYPNSKQSITVTPFGVDTQKFSPNKRLKKSKKFRMGYAKTWLFELYGIKYLIDAFYKFHLKYPESELHIIGIGGVIEKLKTQIRTLDIETSVIFHGLVNSSEIPDFINSWDVAVYPSLRESFGVSIVEASSCGIPVIATNVGGLPEVIDNTKTGYMVAPENSEEIYKKLIYLYENPSVANRLGNAGREKVLNQYDWDKNVDLMLTIYHSLIA